MESSTIEVTFRYRWWFKPLCLALNVLHKVSGWRPSELFMVHIARNSFTVRGPDGRSL